MALQDRVVSELMSQNLATVTADEDLETCERLLLERKVSCLLVVGRDGRAAGVISHTDLLRTGHALARALGHPYLLRLPVMCAGDLMTPAVLSTTADASVLEAARTMVERKVLRLFVLDGLKPVGVLSARDVARMVIDSGDPSPVGDHALTPARTLDASEPLSRATELLVRARLSGIVLTEHDVPVGIFTQPEAVAAREQPPETPVGQWAGYSMLTLPASTPVWRAAAQAAATRARRVVTLDGARPHGVLGGLQFVEALLSAAGRPLLAERDR